MLEFLKQKLVYIIIFILVIICFFLGYCIYDLSQNNLDCSYAEEKLEVEDDLEKEEILDDELIFVDIKGAVKNPGVYEVAKNSIVNDIVNLAGGFSKNAYKNNINLSKKVTDEMVIYVYTKYEYKQKNTETLSNVATDESVDISSYIDNAISIIDKNEPLESNTDLSLNTLVNINTANKEQLLTISGIGDSKAESIIAYREEHGNFKTIEEIKNVSGIGDSLYEKIKNSITV